MFESVDLPAPFSPRSACTSPAAASKSTPSFATTPGKRLTIPCIATATPFEVAVAVELGCSGSRLALRAADHALDEPVHGIQVGHGQALARRDLQLAALVVERALELVELPRDQVSLLLRDRGLRRRADLGSVGREPDEAVLQVAVVEARLPRSGHGGLHAAQVVRPPVVDSGGEPRRGCELLRVRVVADPRDA